MIIAEPSQSAQRAALDSSHMRLKARIEQIVSLSPQPLVLGGRPFDWQRVVNPEILLTRAADNVAQPATELDPFWAATWRAAIGLDHFLQQFDLQDVSVLELGCGSGQAGVGAAVQRARVTMTDAVGLALLVARLNAWPVIDRIRFRRLRWTIDVLDVPPFSVIIGSDLVYDASLFSLLDTCAREHLAADGRMYLSEPHRHTGDKFSRWIRSAGWQALEHDIDLQDNRVPIRVFECWR